MVGNPPQYRITQQQCDELKRLGMEHGVIGLPDPSAKDYQAQMSAVGQELKLLDGNGIRTDVYQYFKWSQNGQPRTDADVRAEMMKQLDALKGQPVKTFWLDVEFDQKLNPDMGAGNSQRMVDTAYQAFQDWKQANPDSKLEFGIYTGKGAWDAISKGPNDPWSTKYSSLGVPLWAAQYPKHYDPKNIANAEQDMAANLIPFGGWSVAAGNVRGWQYRAGEHDGYQPTFHYGLDRNVWLVDDSTPPPPQTAIPSGSRPGVPVQNQALYQLLKQDEGKPIDQRKFKSLQDLINHGGLAALHVDINDCLKYRWEDPWKLVYGAPLGVDQFATP